MKWSDASPPTQSKPRLRSSPRLRLLQRAPVKVSNARIAANKQECAWTRLNVALRLREVVSILAGFLTYALHRRVYRIIIRILVAYLRLRDLVPDTFAWWSDFHASEFRRDFIRWVRHHNYPLFPERLQLWASHVHFLDCS